MDKFQEELECHLDFVKVTINVPEELFAKEPPRWLSTWVNAFYESDKPCDECHFRRRFTFAFTIQPFLVLFLIFFRFLAAVTLVLSGFAGVNFKPVIHPLEDDNSDVWFEPFPIDEDSSYLVKERNLGKHHFKTWFLLSVTPLVPIAFLVLFLILSLKSDPALAHIERLRLIAIVTAKVEMVLIAGSALFQAFLMGIAAVINKMSADIKKAALEKPPTYGYLIEQLLACNGDFSPDLKSLPSERRTINLYYKDFKAKVCKPFARW